ncbi:MAG: sulfotransferase family protein [Phycisphaerae bacterium]
MPITIVSGLPRSGTSMMVHMIDAGGIPVLTDGVRKADEHNPRGYFEFEPVKQTRKDPSWLDQAHGKVVKMTYLLLADLPLDREYRVVFMRRPLDEVIGSQNAMLGRSGRDNPDMPDSRVREVFQAQLQEVERYLAAHANFRVLFVNYSEVIESPEACVHAINGFLGHELDTAAMAAVIDPSLYHQRRTDPN